MDAEASPRTRLGQFLGLGGLRPRLDRELRNGPFFVSFQRKGDVIGQDEELRIGFGY